MTLNFVIRCVTAGLALAFLIVLVRPGLLPALNDSGASDGYAEAVRDSAPAVVNIYTSRPGEAAAGQPARQILSDIGSGVIIDAAGYIVTNHHLIRRASEIRVQLADGRTAIAARVGADPETDLALLKIELSELPAIRLGASADLAIGDIVLAIGNPYGLSQTVTQGIVSATGRGLLDLTTFENFIQTDAAINRGNSGGALINTDGALVGINTATLAEDQSTEGISFAIPVDLVRGVVDDLVRHGRVIRGWLGLVPNLRMLDARDFEQLGIDGTRGILLEQVYQNGPGWNAGLRRYDILTHLNGVAIDSRQQALLLVAGLQPGTAIDIEGYRGRQRFTTTAVAGERPIEPD